jgi:hypothetical protein
MTGRRRGTDDAPLSIYVAWTSDDATFGGLANGAAAATFEAMPSLLKFAARCRAPFAASSGNGRSSKKPCGALAQPLLVLRGVSQQGTIRTHAAKMIAITALHFGTQFR